MDFAEVADELYGAPPEEFTATRDARAKQARAAGERELARRITSLKRPTKTAWLVNVLARRERDTLEELLALGEALREATSSLAGGELRRLGQQRHQVIHVLAQAARQLTGVPLTDAVERELEATLEAALADPAAAGAVRTGRLVRGLTPNGLDPVAVQDAVAAPELGAPAVRPGSVPPPPDASPARRPDAARIRAARAALDQARDSADDAARRLAGLTADAGRADEAAAAAAAEVAERERALEQARADQQAAAQSARQAAEQRRAAAVAEQAARRALAQAEAELQRAENG